MLHAHRPGLCPLNGAESGVCSPLERMLCRTAYPLILLNEHLRNMADFVLNILNPPEMGNIITTISRISKQTRKLSKPTQSPAGIQIREPEFEAGPFTQPCMASRSVKTGCLQGFHEYSKDPALPPQDSGGPPTLILPNIQQQLLQPHLSLLFSWLDIPSACFSSHDRTSSLPFSGVHSSCLSCLFGSVGPRTETHVQVA